MLSKMTDDEKARVRKTIRFGALCAGSGVIVGMYMALKFTKLDAHTQYQISFYNTMEALKEFFNDNELYLFNSRGVAVPFEQLEKHLKHEVIVN